MDKSYTPRLEHKNPDTPHFSLFPTGRACTVSPRMPALMNVHVDAGASPATIGHSTGFRMLEVDAMNAKNISPRVTPDQIEPEPSNN